MSAQPSFVPFTPEERASFLAYRFGSTLDWSSRILVEINYPAEELRWFVDAVQGICKGKERRIAHATIATRAQRFKNPSQAKSLVKRAIDADREWSRLRRSMIFDIESPKPGEREGKDKRARTRYTDYLTPACVWAQEAEQRVKKADEARWKKDSKHRLLKREEILAEAIKMLPTFERVEDMPPGAEPKEAQPLSLSEYAEQRRNIMLAENRRILDRVCDGQLIEIEEIDARIATLEVHYSKALHDLKDSFESTRSYLIKQRSTRMARAADATDPLEAVAAIDEILATKGAAGDPLSDPADKPADWLREIIEPETKGAARDPLSAASLNGNYSYKGAAGDPLSPSVSEAPDDDFEEIVIGDDTPLATPAIAGESAPDMIEAALTWARRGVPVIPLYEVNATGVCVCRAGASCGTPGKHPRIKEWEKLATTDERQIRAWWSRWKRANIGGATGGASRLHFVDIDPKNGGNASLNDLVEAHGAEWLDTFTVETGSGGLHLGYLLPEGVELRNTAGKLAPGIDSRGTCGQIVLAPSLHASGRRYQVKDPKPFRVMDEWMINDLGRAEDAPPAKAVDFQERQTQFTGAVRYFGGGQRDNGLTAVACGRWVHGYAEDVQDLYEQLRKVRDTRCEFIPGDPPPSDAKLFDLAQRTTRKYARGERRQEATV